MPKQLVILAGGMGTRLRSRLGDLPKPLIPIDGKPLLEHQINLARKYGFDHILLFVCYRPDLIRESLGNGERLNVRLDYIAESQPLGTAGAVLAALPQLADRFVILYGDTMVNVDLNRFWNTHSEMRADASLFLHPNNHPLDSDLVECNAQNWIRAFHNRPHPANSWFSNLVNAGLYVVEKSCLLRHLKTHGAIPAGSSESLDFGRDVFPQMLRDGLHLYGYNSPEYIKDIGTPDRYDKVCSDQKRGIIDRNSFSTPQPAVFVDRDGTINPDHDGVRSAEQFELLPGTSEGIQLLNQAGFRVVVVTNQPMIAKGMCSEQDVRTVHQKMEMLLGAEHAFVDRIYFCPHHPERGFPNEQSELKIDCTCRKPKPGMLLQAAHELNLDLAQSWMIGDSTADIGCARSAGVKAILVRSGNGGKDGNLPCNPMPPLTLSAPPRNSLWHRHCSLLRDSPARKYHDHQQDTFANEFCRRRERSPCILSPLRRCCGFDYD